MPVKIFNGEDSDSLEKMINEFLTDTQIDNPKFHYSVASTGYFDQDSKDGDITETYSVLISWIEVD